MGKPKTKNRVGRRPADLKDKRSGKLVAVRPAEKRKGGYVVWLCDCDCGTKNYPVVSRHIIAKAVTSCGCRLRAHNAAGRKRTDRYAKLRKEGMAVAEIAKTFGVTTQAVYKGLKRVKERA
jgi:hypothetical protein